MICVPITQLKSFTEAQKQADIVELWLDEINPNQQELKRLVKLKKKPFIYKVQNLKDFESFSVLPIDYIDLDIQTPSNTIKKAKKLFPKSKLIISHHDFKKTPSLKDLQKISKKAKKKGADIIKIATKAKSLADSLNILSLISDLSSKKQKCICLGMGKEGQITRTAGLLLGNFLTFAPLSIKSKTADGQIPIKELKKLLCHSK